MKIAVLSGKGGAGKTFAAVNLASVAKNSVYIDCDVEEPNGHLFFKPQNITESPVHRLLPQFDSKLCTGCRECVNFCHFNALVYIKEKPTVFSEICHSCGGCLLVCPQKAVSEITHHVGVLRKGNHQEVEVITGVLNLGEASAVPVIQAALEEAQGEQDLTVIDCPPGSSCSVMESISDADYCLLVVEPTAFGFHNFRMVHELVTLLGKPCGVMMNKLDNPYQPLEDFCQENNLPVLLRMPYAENIAQATANGEILAEIDSQAATTFANLLAEIKSEVAKAAPSA